MQLRTFYAQDDEGNALGGADVYVYQPGTTTLATGLKDAAGSDLANPFAADADARIEFAAPSATYDIRVVSGDRDRTIRKVQFADSAEFVKHTNLGSAAYESVAAFATSAQGRIAETAIQQDDADQFATAAQGAKADTALQPADEVRFATAAQGAKADTALQPSGSTINDVTIISYSETVHAATSGAISRSMGGIHTLTLTADTALTWSMDEGEKIQLYLSSAGNNVTDWGVTHWMTDTPTLATENMILVEKVGGNIYAWDGGSR